MPLNWLGCATGMKPLIAEVFKALLGNLAEFPLKPAPKYGVAIPAVPMGGELRPAPYPKPKLGVLKAEVLLLPPRPPQAVEALLLGCHAGAVGVAEPPPLYREGNGGGII